VRSSFSDFFFFAARLADFSLFFLFFPSVDELSRNFLIEKGLTGSDGNVGDIVYFKELLCDTLSAVKIEKYGAYSNRHQHKAHFCHYAFDEFVDEVERIPRQQVIISFSSFSLSLGLSDTLSLSFALSLSIYLSTCFVFFSTGRTEQRFLFW
jgi:hypothetical protein